MLNKFSLPKGSFMIVIILSLIREHNLRAIKNFFVFYNNVFGVRNLLGHTVYTKQPIFVVDSFTSSFGDESDKNF